ncbi:MAG: hypothetical protein C0617_16380 [Desulfuromonas sp.]|uniref:hypothetical protein n=1 Tax=Desulfuromonas sp. TaxID=892 RepID=UPI000CBAA196|nr:hypothetical protein [Desulfuromonas sp.]PLX81667.1 MAG: hypothetical protein C0617_16380 [Desulfuromonas sp.]
MNKPFLCLALIALAALMLPPPAAFARLDPGLDWRTRETGHFLVHFHPEAREVAQRGAAIAEEVHERLIGELGWEPAAKTHLVFADVSDASNGMATPFPVNRMIIYLAPPLDEPYSLTDREDWLRIVITHEYTHILHLDTVRRLPKVLRKIFGRLYFPNAYQPNWVIEGLGTYQETAATEGGRGRASFTDMVLRMAILEGRFPSIAQAATVPDGWPAGQAPYLFGAKFFEYLEAAHGPGLAKKVNNIYAGRPLPFMVDSSARRAFGSTYKEEWRRWQSSLAEHYGERRRDLEAEGLTPLAPLTREGYRNASPVFSPAGDTLAWSSATADNSAALWLMRSDGTGKERLVRRLAVPAGAGLSWSADGRALVYAKLERDGSDNLFYDLFRYDLDRKRETRLTRGARAQSPDVSKATDSLLFVTGSGGRTRLAVAGPGGEGIRHLTGTDSPFDYAGPRWSPDGSRITVGTKDRAGRFAIQVLDGKGRLLHQLPGGAIAAGPAWAPDGRTVFFTSDRSGIFNIYAWRPEEKTLFRVTNLLGGAFSPAASPDGATLVLASYGGGGFDLASLPLDEANWTTVEPPEGNPAPAPPAANRTAENALQTEMPERPYSPFPSLLPRYWFPWFGVDEEGTQYGAITSGLDALERHSWAATLLYGPDSGRTSYSLLYAYDGLYPTLQFFASDRAEALADYAFGTPGGPELDFWERRQSAGLDIRIPFPGTWSRHYLIPGYRFEEFHGLTAPPPGAPRPDKGQLSGVRLSYLFDNTVRPPRSISAEDGRRVSLAVQHNSPGLGSDFRLTKYTLDWREFLDMPWWRHHVLAGRLFGGLADGETLDQRAFRVGGDPPGDILQGLDGESLPLRGYGINEFRGQRAVLASLEYRFPVVNLERGPGNGPFFFRRIHGAVFAEGANAFDSGGLRSEDIRTSSGMEARLDLDLGYVLPITLRLVLARGHDEGGEDQGYLSLWARF